MSGRKPSIGEGIRAMADKAGFWGLQVYWELLRLSEDYYLKDLIHKRYLKPGYIAERLEWTGRVTRVSEGLRDIVPAGLATWDTETLLRVHRSLAFALHSGCTRNALRQRKWRESGGDSHKWRYAKRYASVTPNVTLDTPLGTPDALNPPSEISRAQAVGGLSSAPVAGAPSCVSLPLLVSVQARETPEQLQRLWKEEADPTLPRWREGKDLPPKRRTQATRALKERSLNEWREVIQALNRSPFLLGHSERGWKANLDWLLKPVNADSVLEGAYIQGQGKRQKGKAHVSEWTPEELAEFNWDGPKEAAKLKLKVVPNG